MNLKQTFATSFLLSILPPPLNSFDYINKSSRPRDNKRVVHIVVLVILVGFSFFGKNAFAACSSPTGTEGEQIYNSTHKIMQFCDGTNWYSMRSVGGPDTLAGLSCSSGQVAEWNGSAWVCDVNHPTSIDGDIIIDGTIDSSEIQDNTLTHSDLGTGSVTADEIAANAVGASEIANSAVGSSEVADNSLTSSDLAANSVGASEIAANAVGGSEIANGSIVATTELSATGTKNSSTFLRGDNTWAPAGGGVSGYQIVTNATTSAGHYDVTASCPSGKIVVGGGCNQNNPSHRAVVESFPSSSTSWQCRTRDINIGESVTTTAYAICINN